MSVFKSLQTGDVVIGRIQTVSAGIFPAEASEWSVFSTSSTQVLTTGSSYLDPKSGLYYYQAYSANPELDDTAEAIFDVSYGHTAGTGSSDLDRTKYKIFPTKAVYSQYKNLILTPDDAYFSFQSGSGTNSTFVDSPEIYVINFSTNKTKEQIDPGLLEFTISGDNGDFTFVDDSPNQTTKKSVYNIVSGSLETDSSAPVVGSPSGLGLFYPQLGVVVLNAQTLSTLVGSNLAGTDGGASDYALNHVKLYESLRDGAQVKTMKARSSEYIPSRQFFIRVKNNEFNYSNNPSFIYNDSETGNSSDEGKLRFSDFYNDPHVYITSVGLYDDSNELIAVAKLSQPLEKTFDSEALIKIKLDI